MPEIRTERLRLIALTMAQLRLCLEDMEQLEQELDLTISRDVVTSTVYRAIRMKMAKMVRAEEKNHLWYTYWLVVVGQTPFGAGLAGFKGAPNRQGEVEIGYGIDPGYQRKGYMTEAVQALIDWAFTDRDEASTVVAETMKSNISSHRVLQKVGMEIFRQTEEAFYWRIQKAAKLR